MRDIPNFEKLYAIDETGKVWSYYTNKYLTPSLNGAGYYQVILVKDKIKYHKTIHRLVAETFIPNPNNLQVVNHKDEDKTNNNVDNLEWCSHKYNSNYGSAPARLSEKLKEYNNNNPFVRTGENNPKSIQIKCIETQEIFPSFTAACKWCNIQNTVCFTDYFNGQQSYVGKHPITNIPLHWEKLEDGKWISAKPYKRIPRSCDHLKKKIKCKETGQIFNSITEARKLYPSKHIGECCDGKRKSACGHTWEWV